jgi:hypothetical protein
MNNSYDLQNDVEIKNDFGYNPEKNPDHDNEDNDEDFE